MLKRAANGNPVLWAAVVMAGISLGHLVVKLVIAAL